MSHTAFSVLLSVYSKEKETYLIDSLNSIINQTLPPNEIILVKDGPLPDKLNDIINSFQTQYPILKVISLKQNQGLGTATIVL